VGDVVGVAFNVAFDGAFPSVLAEAGDYYNWNVGAVIANAYN
jgi:hypothetical protein